MKRLLLCLLLAGCSHDPDPVPMGAIKEAMEACAPHGGLRQVAKTLGSSYSCGWKCYRHTGGFTAICENDIVINKSYPVPDVRP